VTSSEGAPSCRTTRRRASTSPFPAAPSSAATRAGGGAHARLDQVARLAGLVAVQGLFAGPPGFQACHRRAAPDETALALLGFDPAVLAQYPQRPDHGGPGDLEFIAKLMLTGQQRSRRVFAGLDPPPQLVNDLRVSRRLIFMRYRHERGYLAATQLAVTAAII
jgi:hypothetical protein